jgi:hypothetical protein
MVKLVYSRSAGAYPVALAVVLIVALGASFFAAQEAKSVSNSKPAGPMPSVSIGGSGGPIGLVGALYGDNGLSCTLPPSPTSGPDIDYLVPKVVQAPAFLRATNGAPYILNNAENYGDGWINVGGKIVSGPLQNFSIIGGNTTITPPGAELVFYSYGAGTSCEGNGPVHTGEIVVHVPLENGAYNMTGIWVHPRIQPYNGVPPGG